MRARHEDAGAWPAGWTGPFGLGGQHAARFHRETDRRLRRAMVIAVVGASVLVTGVLGLVALKVHQVRLSYRLDTLRTSKAALEERTRLLRVEVATLRSLARIEDKARGELGMVSPSPSQVQLAREFVTGGRALGALTPSRTASAERRGPGEAQVR